MHTKYVSLLFVFLFSALLTSTGFAQEKKKPTADKPPPITDKHYRIYDAKGQPASLADMLKKMQAAQVIFLGESHDDPVAHHLQAKLFEELHNLRKDQPARLALALEMFERDVQHILDEYLADLITEQHFLGSSRPWKNYQDDYRPLVEYAKKHNLPVIATNAPRRYVNRVGRLGADSLQQVPNPMQRGLPPLPYGEASLAYAKRFKEVMEKMHKEHAKKAPEKKSDKKKSPEKKVDKKKPAKKPAPAHTVDLKKSLQAQSLWDATMAYSIVEHLLARPSAQIVHVNGSFHSDSRLGIPEHLLRYRPGTELLVVTILPDKLFPGFDAKTMKGRGDFVIVTDPAIRKKTASK